MLAVLCTAFFGFMIYKMVEHDRFLKEHGCQLYFVGQTGKWEMIGKVMTPEKVYVYECADGRRMELH